jgi:cytochrome c oxidase subunit I+III
MPRRVYTYPAGLGWDALNLVSTLGAFMIAAGVAVFVVDVCRRLRVSFEDNAGNVWNAGTLEWLPSGTYSTRSIPIVESREPLWDQPGLAKDVEAGRYYLPVAPTGGRETLLTSPIEAQPQAILQMPYYAWSPFVGAVFTAAAFMLLTVKLSVPAAVCGVIAIAAIVRWAWELDPGPAQPPVDIGGGLRVPIYLTGPAASSWLAMVVLILVASSLFACLVGSYVYLWTVSKGAWLPPPGDPLMAGAMLAASSAAVGYASRALKRDRAARASAALLVAVPLVICASAVELGALWASGLSPARSSYGALVYTFAGLQAFYALTVAVMAVYTIARERAGLIDRVRRVTFDNTMLLWHYAVVQGLVGLAFVHAFPRLTS